MPKRISVIIPTYRDWERLALCLKALRGQTLSQDDFEVIVVNNDADGNEPALNELPGNCIIAHEPRPGSYSARNRGLALACGEYVAFTDSDCIPASDWLDRGLQLLKANPGSRVTGPVPIFREPNSGYLAHLFEAHTAFPQRLYVEREQSCVTANLLVARDVFDRVGLFNDSLFSGGDFEWNRRASALNIPILYDDKLAVHHPARRTMAEILSKQRRVAGTHARDKDVSSPRYILRKLAPPLRVTFSRNPQLPYQLATVYMILWATQIAAVYEFILVRSGIKLPSRT